MCNGITLETRTEGGSTYLVINGSGYNPYSMFPWIPENTDGRRAINKCPIVQALLTDFVFRKDPNPSAATSAGIIIPGYGKFDFYLNYNAPLNVANYNNYFNPTYGDYIIQSMKASKHLAFTLALKLAGEAGWQAMPHDNGNRPCANSMKLNYELNGKPTHLNRTANDNGNIQGVFPQHGLAHATNYGITVIPIYGNGIPKSLAQLNLYDYLINWRRLYAVPGYQAGLTGAINPPNSDGLVQALNTKVQMGNTDRYKHSFISVYATAHRVYGGFPTRNKCYQRLVAMDVHPILCMHAAYMVATQQNQLCDFPIWLVLPFRPLFIIMIQVWHMKTGKPLGALSRSSWKVVLEVEENKKIFTNVFERQYHVKFPKGSIKDSHDCIMKEKTKTKCPKKFPNLVFDKYMQNVFDFAFNYTNSAYATAHTSASNNKPNNVIAAMLSYTLSTVILAQEGALAKPEMQKHYGYVDPQKHSRNVNKWKEVLGHAIDTAGYIDDVIRSELYFLIDRPPDPSVDVYPECR